MPITWPTPPLAPRTITTLDTHAAGEPLRIVTGGLPDLKGNTMLERRREMRERYDDVRRALMWEPRGHADMYGCVVTPPVSAGADFGVLFMHNEGYSTMCGHGVIALVTALVECGIVDARVIASPRPSVPVTLDTPAGVVRATAHVGERGQVERVSFLNVPSFIYARDLEIEVSGHGRVLTDVAFGGAFYAVLPAERIGLTVEPRHTSRLVEAGEAIKAAVNATIEVRHPTEPDLSFLYGTILTGAPEDPTHHSRNVCVFANAEVDRSPTGTGVSARIAIHAARGEVADGETIQVESILGARSVFGVRVAERTRIGNSDFVVPEVSGSAYITGRSEFFLDPRDRLGAGFLLSRL